MHVLHVSGPWRKWPGMAPNGARRMFFPTNPDLADILGRTDLEFENFHFFHAVDPQFLHFQVPRFLKFGLGRAWTLDLGGGGEMLASHILHETTQLEA